MVGAALTKHVNASLSLAVPRFSLGPGCDRCYCISLQVIDPGMPEDGMRVNGEFIQAPSEEVLEHKEKNPQNTILVRFFDGRRTW